MAPSARVLRQLIVNACSLSDVAFTLLASFRGLAVSPCASFERLTLYHSRVIKQAVILRVVLQSRPDLRCIEGHRRRHSPSSPKFLPDVRRFCRDPSAHRRFVDEHLFISPVQGGAEYSDPLVFGRLPEKPAHIEQKVFRDGSRRRGQQSSICEDSFPPSARLPRKGQQKPRSQAVEDKPKHPGGAFGLTYRRFLSTTSRSLC